MKKRNILSLLLALILMACFAACDKTGGSEPSGGGGAAAAPGSFEVGSDKLEEEAVGASEYDPTYTVNLKIVGGDDTVLYNGTVSLKSPTMWANEFLRAAVTDKGLAQSGIEVGFVDTIGDYVNNSTDGIYWTYTVNGLSPMVGSNQYQLRDGDYMLWTYAPYAEPAPVEPVKGDWAFEVGGDKLEEEAVGASEYDPTYTVNLKIVGGDDTVLYNGTVSLKSPTMWANEFLRAAVTDKGLAQSGIEVGFVDTIGDYVNNSTDGIYWTYTVNGLSPMVGSNQYQLRDGDYMLWTYASFE